ncbi:ABC transporter ATP-binding protein [Amycolatopsis pithecellobii]|uniref:ABC transporter ATP-binding protein n=1 Tax=Amycolatopsis pithecellobii TaxID=664692 RepID=UPI001407A3AB|nr:ATP-binding cassette domain-containing protein [Amycolatopsis pithecellobii]
MRAPEPDVETVDRPVVAELSEVAVRYSNGALGVERISFEVRAGQIVALFGPNGAGKTTSVRALCGFLRSEQTRIERGRVTLLDRDVTGLEAHKIARMGVSFVPERDKVFANLTVADNLRAAGDLPRQRQALHDRLDQVFELFPALADLSRQAAGQLSGGQQQMLALGRAVLRHPRLLVVDELTLGLHHSLHEPLFDALQRITRNGTAVIVVDESAGFSLDVAHHCYLLVGGVVRDSGPPEKFRGSELLAAGYVEA